MPRWRKRSQKSVLEVFEVNVLSFQGACVKNVTLNRPICRATHVINLSLGLEMLNVTKPLKTGLFFTAFIRLDLDKQEL